MGVDAQMYIGEGILINPHYLDDSWKDFLDEYFSSVEVDNEMCLCSAYSKVSDEYIIIWSKEPQQILFDQRRPLIINSPDMLHLMVPNGDSVDLSDERLWNPGYVPFAMVINQYEGSKETEVVNKVVARLRQKKLKDLIPLVKQGNIRLVGNILAYHVQ